MLAQDKKFEQARTWCTCSGSSSQATACGIQGERLSSKSQRDESRVTCHLSRSMMDPPLISCYCTYTVVVRLARPHSHTQELIQLYVESFDPTACTSALLRVLSWLC